MLPTSKEILDRWGVERDGQLLMFDDPDDIGIGSGDYINFDWCLDCGRIQDNFPLSPTALEQDDME